MLNSQKHTSSPNLLQKLLRMLSLTRPREISCDEVYELMDQYVELQARGEDVQALMPLVAHHIEICPECREEYEALLQMIEQSS